MYIQYIILIWSVAILTFSFFRLKWGIALFLAFVMLVPIAQIPIGNYMLGINYIRLPLFLIFLTKLKLSGMKWKPFRPFLLYFGISILMMPFQFGMPLSDMMYRWRTEFVDTLFVPFLIWNIMKNDNDSVLLFRYTMLFCIIVSVGYGLYLTTLDGINPYILILQRIIGSQTDLEFYYSESSGGNNNYNYNHTLRIRLEIFK